MKRFCALTTILFLGFHLAPCQEEWGVLLADPVYRIISVDGDVSDWDGVNPAYIDSIGDQNGSPFDFAAAYIANDENNLYIRISFAEPSPFGESGWLVNVVFNTDLDAGTGYGFAGLTGSEFFIQSGGVFDQRSGQNFVDVVEQTAENNWGAFASADTAPYEETRDVEIALARDLTFSDDENGLPGLLNPDDLPLFEYPDFIILFEAENLEYASVEFMPNADPNGGESGLLYEFAGKPAKVPVWDLY
ncbi:MAG: hypothetical protein ACP5I1_15675 [Candidatus Hinthialibacter sp.]